MATPEKLFHELLGLGLKWEVTESRFDSASGTVVLSLQETPELWPAATCPKDGGSVSCYDHPEVLSWRHLNIFQHSCEITCRLPRGKCRKCGHVFRVRPPWEGLCIHFTKEFEAYALLLLREMPVARVAEIVKETDTRLWRMIFRHVEGAYALADFSNVCCVGADEMSVRKGQHYITVFADMIAKRVLFATEGHDAKTWGTFVEALAKHNGHPHALTEVSIDMSAAYQKGVHEYCKNAEIVFDKFHVLAKASKQVDQVRRAEIRKGGSEVWPWLNKSQWLWRKNPANHSQEEKERLVKITNKNLSTAKAYQMRLVLREIYKSSTATVARRKLRAWIRWVRWVARKTRHNLLEPMEKLARMVEDNMKGILAHWKSGLTNAFMEGLNSVFSAVKRKARGYRSSEYLITMLYFVAGKLRLPHS